MRKPAKILSMILAVVMVLGLLPATAFATGAEDVVYLSISLDTGYIDDINGNPITYVPVPMSKIKAIDLAEYGLDNMLFDADGDGAYVEGIHNLYEFDCGALSGWMYKVNGWYPNYGSSRYQLKDGDVVEWRFTCDLGNDIGGGYAVGG